MEFENSKSACLKCLYHNLHCQHSHKREGLIHFNDGFDLSVGTLLSVRSFISDERSIYIFFKNTFSVRNSLS